jgi:nitronate monooxygenase
MLECEPLEERHTGRLGEVEIPQVVLAPLAGGPSTPELAAAVANAGGLGFVAGGYLRPEELDARLRRARELTDGALGVNLFVLRQTAIDEAALTRYADQLAGEGHELGAPRFDDDWLDEKIEVAVAADVQVISTAFGPPPRALLDEARVPVWATIASVADAGVEADALVVQGTEAGGHRGAFDDNDESDQPLLDLLRLLREDGRPLIAAGGIHDGASARRTLDAGATAVQAGTAFLLCPEAGTYPVHRAAIERGGETAITRAFTGRRARGIVNAFMRDHVDAPSAYPQINHLTAPMRAAARAAGDPDRVNLWAGTSFAHTRARPAAEVVASLRP